MFYVEQLPVPVSLQDSDLFVVVVLPLAIVLTKTHIIVLYNNTFSSHLLAFALILLAPPEIIPDF